MVLIPITFGYRINTLISMDINKLKIHIGAELIEGKAYLPHEFKPGNTLGGDSRKGLTFATLKERTEMRMQKVKNLPTFKRLIATEGIERVWNIMQRLDDLDFLRTFILIAPYCLPKIAAVEHRSTDYNDNDNITELKEITHTIVVKDFRTGLTTAINDK